MPRQLDANATMQGAAAARLRQLRRNTGETAAAWRRSLPLPLDTALPTRSTPCLDTLSEFHKLACDCDLYCPHTAWPRLPSLPPPSRHPPPSLLFAVIASCACSPWGGPGRPCGWPYSSVACSLRPQRARKLLLGQKRRRGACQHCWRACRPLHVWRPLVSCWRLLTQLPAATWAK